MDTYGRIEQLLKKNRISAYKLSQETGISTGLLSQWKKRTQTPSTEKLKSVASYFDVSIDYLLTGEAQKEKPLVNKDEGLTEIKKDFIGDIKQLTDEDIQSLRPVVKNLLKNNDK